jgi:hypothetical protein
MPDAARAALVAAHARLEPIDDTPFVRVSFYGSETEVTDATLQALLAAKSNIAELNLGRTQVGARSGEVLLQLTNLQRLDLRESGITDACIPAIAKLPHLQSLNLFGTKITDAGLLALGTCSSLRQLYVWQTPVSANGVVALQQKLPKARIVFAPDLPEPAADDTARPGRRRGK